MYIFPRVPKVHDRNEQIKKISEEFSEVIYAMLNESDEKIMEESYDLIHATEQLIRIVEKDSGILHTDIWINVEQKNKRRGYYGEER